MNCPICDFPNLAAVASCRSCGSPLRDRSSSAASNSATSENVSIEDDDALPVGATLSFAAYRIERVLGQGGFGITYLCRDVRLERAVAIKEFFPSGCRRAADDVRPSRALSPTDYAQAKTRFLEEARVLARFKHQGIVDVHTVFEENNSAYMVMEFLEGRSLSDLLQQRDTRRMKEDEALHYIERAGDALNAVHERGLLHRDLKPDNIIACNDGRVMLIDFGTAREYSSQQTHGHTVVVTPGYAPLEQYAQQAKRGAYTDVYGLAATLYHLLTGEVPAAASDRAMGVELVPPRELNPHMSTHVARAIEIALQTETNKRPQSARAFLDLLRDTAISPQDAAIDALDSDSENGWQKADAASPKGHLDIADLHETWADRKQPSVDFSALIRARKDLLQSPDPDTRRFADFLATQPDATPDDGAATSKALDPQASNDWHNAVFDHIDQNLNTLSGKPLSPTNFLAAPNARANSSQDGDSEVQSQSLAPFVPLKATQPVSALPKTPLFSAPIPYESSSPLVNYSLPSLSLFWRWLAVLAFLGWIFAMSISQGRVHPPHPGPPPISYGFNPSPVTRTAASNKPLPQDKATFIVPAQWVQMPEVKDHILMGALSQNGKVAAYKQADSIKVWSIAQRRLLRTIAIPPNEVVHPETAVSPKIALSADGALLYVEKVLAETNWDGNKRYKTYKTQGFHIWDVRTGKRKPDSSSRAPWDEARTARLARLVKALHPDGYPDDWRINWSYALSSDGKIWVGGGRDGNVTWRDVKSASITARRDTDPSPYMTSQDDREALATYRLVPRGGRETADDPLPVQRVVFSPDGKLVAACNDVTISLFDSQTRELFTFKAPDQDPNTLVFSPDGAWLASRTRTMISGNPSATYDEVAVWNTKTGRLTRLVHSRWSKTETYKLETPKDAGLYTFSFSSDGKSMLGIDGSGKLLRWSLNPSAALRAFDPQPQTIELSKNPGNYLRPSISGSSLDGNRLARVVFTESDIHELQMWDIKRNRLLWASPYDGRGPALSTDITLSADGSRLAIERFDFSPKPGDIPGPVFMVRDGRTGEITSQWRQKNKSDIYGSAEYRGSVLALSPDGKTLISREWVFGKSQEVKTRVNVWDAGTGKLIRTLPFSERITSLAFAPDGKTWVSHDDDTGVTRWHDALSGKVMATRTLEKKGENFRGEATLTFSPNGTLLVFGTREIKIFDPQRKLLHSLDMSSMRSYPYDIEMAHSYVSLSPDGTLLAISGRTEDMTTIHLPSKTVLQDLRWPRLHPSETEWSSDTMRPIRFLRFSSDGTQLRGVSDKGESMTWNLVPASAGTRGSSVTSNRSGGMKRRAN